MSNNAAVTADGGVGPQVGPDSASTTQGKPVDVPVLANDKPGTSGSPLDPASVKLLDGTGKPVTTLTVPNQGTYTVDPTTGAVTFTPVPTFTSISYLACAALFLWPPVTPPN